MGDLTLTAITKSFGAVEVIKGVDLTVPSGEFCVIVGPSGCGKSTLLRIIAGLEDATTGEVRIDGAVVNDTPPSQREIAMVFQSYALYPHLTVRGNMGLGLKQGGASRAQVTQAVARASAMLELDPLLDRRPAELSGGQRQRVAIGRAIVRTPKLFLFDEPLSNLDAALRVATRIEIARLHRELAATMIYVTHDQVEAMTLADRMIVMNDGRAEQIGRPLEIYDDPATTFVAGFIGSPPMNFLPDPEGGGVTGVRPEHLQLCTPLEGLAAGRIRFTEALGAETLAHVALDGGGLATIRLDARAAPREGEAVGLAADPARLYRFDAAGARLRA